MKNSPDMLVIDTSAIIAILIGEEPAETLKDRIMQAEIGSRWMSVASYIEAGTVFAGRIADPLTNAAQGLDMLLSAMSVTLVPVSEEQARMALQARIRFGRSFGHGAKLNFGDCFAYALAKSLGAPLLFTGDDFAATDVRPALHSA